MQVLSSRQRGNLVKVLVSFSGIIFATMVVGTFRQGFNIVLFGTGLILTLFLISVILWVEP